MFLILQEFDVYSAATLNIVNGHFRAELSCMFTVGLPTECARKREQTVGHVVILWLYYVKLHCNIILFIPSIVQYIDYIDIDLQCIYNLQHDISLPTSTMRAAGILRIQNPMNDPAIFATSPSLQRISTPPSLQWKV